MTFVRTNGRPDMLTRKVMNKNSHNKENILLDWKKYIWYKYFLLDTKLFWLNKNVFWYHEKKNDVMKIYLNEYKSILIE